MGKAVDLTGQRFGRLVAIEPTDKRYHEQVVWKCKCDCGGTVEISQNSLKKGATKSCGCLLKEAQKKHLNEVCVEGTNLELLLMKKNKRNTSGVKGVYWEERRGKWRASINLRGKCKNLGRFDKKEDAAAARKEAEEKYFAPILEKYGFAENE